MHQEASNEETKQLKQVFSEVKARQVKESPNKAHTPVPAFSVELMWATKVDSCFSKCHKASLKKLLVL